MAPLKHNRRRIPRLAANCAALASLLCGAAPAAADIFVLANGGEVRGELVNADESPRKLYVVKTYSGGQITLEAGLVSRVLQQKPDEVQYERLRLAAPDTVEGHWKLAEWCKEHRLRAQRRRHLERIIELDTDHAEARRLLGYRLFRGRWLTRDEEMLAKGRVKYENQWLLPQEVELIEQRKQREAKRQAWIDKINRWRGWLDGDRSHVAETNLVEIKDPAAAPVLISLMKKEDDYRIKLIFAKALANTATKEAITTLVEHTLKDPHENFRFACLDLLEKTKPRLAVGMYVTALQSKDNAEVNRAAIGLSRMENKSAVFPLIEALVTTHKVKVGRGQPGQLSPTFTQDGIGGGNIGFGVGNQAKIVTVAIRNSAVLETLIRLTGENFDYDVAAWTSWYASQKKQAPPINPRRD